MSIIPSTSITAVPQVTYNPRNQPIIPGGSEKYFRDELANISRAIQAINKALQTLEANIHAVNGG